MRAVRVPQPLAERLGEEASAALLDMFDVHTRAVTEAVVSQCTERFERRLVEETSKLRVELAQLRSDLRQEIATMGSGLRAEMVTMGSGLRTEMATMRSDLRQEIAAMGSDLRQEIATMGSDLRHENSTTRVELLKWAFLFWVGQLVSVVAVVGLLIRTMPAR